MINLIPELYQQKKRDGTITTNPIRLTYKRVVIVGMGNMGQKRARHLRETGFYVIGVDVDPEKRRNRDLFDIVYENIHVTPLQEGDLIFVCTGPTQHVPIIEAIGKRNFQSMFVEKPLAQDFEHATVLERFVHDRKPIWVGCNWKFSPIYGEIRDTILYCPSILKKIEFFARANILDWPYAAHRSDPNCRGVITEMGSHMLYLLEYVTGGTIIDYVNFKRCVHADLPEYKEFAEPLAVSYRGEMVNGVQLAGSLRATCPTDEVVVKAQFADRTYAWQFPTAPYGLDSIEAETRHFAKYHRTGLSLSTAIDHMMLLEGYDQ